MKQTGGSGQYGHVKMRVEPLPRARASSSSTRSRGGTIPKEFIPPIEKGIDEALEGGVLAGYPMSDVKVTLYDGSYHDVDSSEMAFKICRLDGVQGSGQQGQAGAARAGDERRSRGAGRVHGRRERRSELAPRPHRRHWNCAAPRRSSSRWCRCRRCSATPPSCVRARRAAAASPCTSASTKKCRKNIAEEIISKVQGKATQ